VRIARLGKARQVTVRVPAGVLTQLLPKGSIALDGVSLTLDEGPFVRSFTVTLIPETLRQTRLSALRPGDLVNLEADVLAKAGRRQASGTRHSAFDGATRDTAEGRGPNAASRSGLTVQDARKYGWQ
jgi:riboflavin synthase